MSDEREHSDESSFGEAERIDLLIGYLENELDADEAELVEERLETDPSARATLESFESTRELLAGLDTPAPSAEATDRAYQAVLAAMAAGAPAEVSADEDANAPGTSALASAPSAPERALAPQGRLIVWTRWIAAAACLAVAGLLVLDTGKPKEHVAKVESAPRVAPAKVAPKAPQGAAAPAPVPGKPASPAASVVEKEAEPRAHSPAAAPAPAGAPKRTATRDERDPSPAEAKDALDSVQAEVESFKKREERVRGRENEAGDRRPAGHASKKKRGNGPGREAGGGPADMADMDGAPPQLGSKAPPAPRKPEASPAPPKASASPTRADRTSRGRPDPAQAEESLQEDLAKLSEVLEERALKKRPEAPTGFRRARRDLTRQGLKGGTDREPEPVDDVAEGDEKSAERKLHPPGPRAALRLGSKAKSGLRSKASDPAEAWVVGEDEDARLYVLRGGQLAVASARTLSTSERAEAQRAGREQVDSLDAPPAKGGEPAAGKAPADEGPSTSEGGRAPRFGGAARAPSVRSLKLAAADVAHVSSRVRLEGSAREDVVAILGRELRALSVSRLALEKLAQPRPSGEPERPSANAPGAPGAQGAKEDSAKANAAAKVKAHAVAEARVRKLLRLLGHEANDPRQFPKLYERERARVRAGR